MNYFSFLRVTNTQGFHALPGLAVFLHSIHTATLLALNLACRTHIMVSEFSLKF